MTGQRGRLRGRLALAAGLILALIMGGIMEEIQLTLLRVGNDYVVIL